MKMYHISFDVSEVKMVTIVGLLAGEVDNWNMSKADTVVLRQRRRSPPTVENEAHPRVHELSQNPGSTEFKMAAAIKRLKTGNCAWLPGDDLYLQRGGRQRR